LLSSFGNTPIKGAALGSSPSTAFPSNSYLNEYRVVDYKRIFESHFEEVHYYEEEYPDHEIYLTDNIRRELSDYSEYELFTDWLLVLCRK
jgi:hypothetical protein